MQTTKDFYDVTIDGGVKLCIGGRMSNLMAAALSDAEFPVMIRLVGGMTGNGPIYSYFDEALSGLDGSVLWSGATRSMDGDKIAESVAEVVARMGLRYPKIITMGSCPRTEYMTIQGKGQLHLSNDVIVNPQTEYVAVIQNGPDNGLVEEGVTEGALGWNGDLVEYFRFMTLARELMEFKLGTIVYNAGGVSVEEAFMAIENDIPVFVVENSGRHCNPDFKGQPGKLHSSVFSGSNIYHVDVTNPAALRMLLSLTGLSK